MKKQSASNDNEKNNSEKNNNEKNNNEKNDKWNKQKRGKSLNQICFSNTLVIIALKLQTLYFLSIGVNQFF